MTNWSLNYLEIPLMKLKQCNKKQDDSPFVVYDYDYSEPVEIISIEEKLTKHTTNYGVPTDRKLVSATISVLFKSMFMEAMI